jgi:hypothetical protein
MKQTCTLMKISNMGGGYPFIFEKSQRKWRITVLVKKYFNDDPINREGNVNSVFTWHEPNQTKKTLLLNQDSMVFVPNHFLGLPDNHLKSFGDGVIKIPPLHPMQLSIID